MQKYQKSVDSPNTGLNPQKPSLATEIATKLPSIVQGAFSQENTNILTSTGRFLILPFLNWRFLRLIIALLAFYVLTQFDAKAQYQEYPISPPPTFSTAPKYSKQDSLIIARHSQNIVSNAAIQKGPSNTVVCDLFLKDSRITSISKVGSYWRVKAQFRSYTDLYFFKAKYHNLAWIRKGMRTAQSESKKRYVQSIHENKERIAARNEALRDSLNNENRSFISKIINPHE